MDSLIHPRIAARRARVAQQQELQEQFNQTGRRVETLSRSGMGLLFLSLAGGVNPWLLGASATCFGLMTVESFFGLRFNLHYGSPPAPRAQAAAVIALPSRVPSPNDP
jgi:hypothetical protein